VDSAAGRALIGSMADAVTGGDPAAAARVLARLSGLSGRVWLRLDELARLRGYWQESPLDRVTDWRPVLAAGGEPVAGVAASMCRDGRVREAAVAVLAGMPGPMAAAALAVRTADWVPEVSSAAVTAVSARTAPGDAAVVVPVMLALRERRRGRQAADGYLAGVAQGPAAALAALTAAGERSGRLWALGALAERSLLTTEVLTARAERDRDPVVALWCARQLAVPGGLPAAAGPRLLTSARAAVRAFAAERLDDNQLTRETLRGLLLDRSAAVRSVARWRWTRRRETPGPVYREALTAAGPPRLIAAALEGLDDTSDGSLPAAAVPFMTHPSPRVRSAAVHAVGRHSAAVIPGQLAPLLHDTSGKVVAAALRYLHGYILPPGVLAGLDAAGTARSRRAALSVRQHLGPWDRIHADLVAINGEDPLLAEAARTDLLAWLQHGAATTYDQPSAGQAAEIAGLLGTSKLTDKERREVAFVVGIRTITSA